MITFLISDVNFLPVNTDKVIDHSIALGGHLIDIINGYRDKDSLTPRVVLLIFIQCCKAVAHMHSQKPPVIHRDLKVPTVTYFLNVMISVY